MTPELLHLLQSHWEPVPSIAIGLIAMLAAYLWGTKFKLTWKTFVFILGIAILWLGLMSPLDELGDEYLFSAHMVQHMVLATVVPVLVVFAAPVTLGLRALPARAATHPGDGSRGPREWLLALVHSRVAGFFSNPVVAAINFAGSMIAFYYSEIFGWSLRTPEGHLFMVAHFSLAGYLFANALVGVDPGPKRPGYPQRLLLLFATMALLPRVHALEL